MCRAKTAILVRRAARSIDGATHAAEWLWRSLESGPNNRMGCFKLQPKSGLLPLRKSLGEEGLVEEQQPQGRSFESLSLWLVGRDAVQSKTSKFDCRNVPFPKSTLAKAEVMWGVRRGGSLVFGLILFAPRFASPVWDSTKCKDRSSSQPESATPGLSRLFLTSPRARAFLPLRPVCFQLLSACRASAAFAGMSTGRPHPYVSAVPVHGDCWL